MTITLYQQDIVWLNPEANYQKIEKVLAENPDTELLILPEMCTSGFITIPQPGQIEEATAVEQRLTQLSQRYNTAICGSFAVSINPLRPKDAHTEGCNRNRAYFVTPEGEVWHYDKHHLFTPGLEDHGYKAGDQRLVVTWRGIRFMVVVCYDLRFPTWLRYRNDAPYDILICVANWPLARQSAWDILLKARAIENQAFCIGVNRVGQDTMCEYQGGTCAIHPFGHVIASCPDHEESVCTFTPDMERLVSFRQKFPSLNDAD